MIKQISRDRFVESLGTFRRFSSFVEKRAAIFCEEMVRVKKKKKKRVSGGASLEEEEENAERFLGQFSSRHRASITAFLSLDINNLSLRLFANN